MTNAESKKLETIIGKLEALENCATRKTREEAEAMHKAKRLLMSIFKY